MKRHLTIQEPSSDDGSGYSQSTKLAESIIGFGVVLILCVTVTVIGVLAALSAMIPSREKEAVTESHPPRQMELSVNSTKPLYIVQSGSIEIHP